MKVARSCALLAVNLMPILVISARFDPGASNPRCGDFDPRKLRADRMTVVISGYSEERLPLLNSIIPAYSASPAVAEILLLWGNPSTSPRTLADLARNLSSSSAAVLRPPSSSLNHRFFPWDAIRTRAVLICDDDIEPDPASLAFAFAVWRSDPDRAVGFFARSHAYDVASRSWIYAMDRERYSIVLTKFVLLDLKHLRKYSCGEEYAAARLAVEETNNCEDILMNFVVAEETGKGPVMVAAASGGGVRDYGDWRNDRESAALKGVGLSSRRKEHMKRRGDCIGEFHRILGRMPLKYSYGKVVKDVDEQGLCQKAGRLLPCDQHLPAAD